MVGIKKKKKFNEKTKKLQQQITIWFAAYMGLLAIAGQDCID